MRIESTARGPRAPKPVAPDKADAGAPNAVDPRVVLAYDPDHPDAVRARDIRAELLAGWPSDDGGRRAVALVAPDNAARLGEVAANVAVAFAQLGRTTLVIDADMLRPIQHELFRLGAGAGGLADVLDGRVDLADAAMATAVPGLRVVPAGPADERLRDAVERRPLLERLDERLVRADLLIVPISGYGAGALATALTHFDAAVPVVRRGRTRMRALKGLVEALTARDVRVGGVVLS